ncbi:response regulator transcription factor [Azospirillum picis]|uniref:FixJ family two-component response regulator n=1 Tax=Azospirillum picis TaxID=488438 RepID=A0ABU0MRP4_9PROT|nr:response regulator [Azospirillum picis]MBP2302405.1 FixJ family two-component response regulator [Azospirillum picis]MDQ0535984.1 FixJ family two-component response regulator [Azospirillum picis]
MEPKAQDQKLQEAATVVVIDDDESVREALEGLVESVGLEVRTFESVQHYLDVRPTVEVGCMVLDVRLPGRSGLDYHAELVKSKNSLPIIFISGHADVPMSVSAMKAGAFEFLTKPIHHQKLLDAIHGAIEQHRLRRGLEQGLTGERARFETLTAREREVTLLVVAGQRNKQIAGALGLSEATVKLHRGQAMRKMEVNSVVELVRVVDRLIAEAPLQMHPRSERSADPDTIAGQPGPLGMPGRPGISVR